MSGQDGSEPLLGPGTSQSSADAGNGGSGSAGQEQKDRAAEAPASGAPRLPGTPKSRGTAKAADKPAGRATGKRAATAAKRKAGKRRVTAGGASGGRRGASGKRTRAGGRLRAKRGGSSRELSRRSARRNRQEGTEAELRNKEQGDKTYAEGYEQGLYDGGEQWLEQAMPQNLLLPEVPLRDIIALGVGQLRDRCYPLLGVPEVYEEMEAAIAAGRSCSVVRLGDGELLALSQDVVYDEAAVRREGRFLPYAGLHAPDLAARDQLAMALRHAQIVGVPLSRRKNFQPLLHHVLRGHGIEPGALRMTHSTINYGLYQSGLLARLLAGRRLLLVGNAAPALARSLTDRGLNVAGVISPVAGFDDIERVLSEMRQVDFDIALVSAGIPAVVLCWRIAMERGKTALDFGHMADTIVKESG